MSTPLRIMIASNHVIFRQGLRALLAKRTAQFQVVGETVMRQDAVSVVAAISPDGVLLDMRTSDAHSVAFVTTLKRSQPETKIVALAPHAPHSKRHRGFKKHVDAYLWQYDGGDELFATLYNTVYGNNNLSRLSAKAARVHGKIHATMKDSPILLTRRERQTLKGVAEGKNQSRNCR